jgi:hyperosmotically inducible protein
MRRILLVIIPVLILSACSHNKEQTNTSMRDQARPDEQAYRSDNSGVNKSEKNYTAENQSNDAKDVDLTANIRKALMNEKSLSFNAQNIKVITEAGKVTLRGPVDTASEKARVAQIAKGVPGVTSVNDETMTKDKSVATKGEQQTR